MANREIPKIQTQVRDRLGTRYSRRLREAGRLPAVVYGHGQDPLHISVDAEAFAEVLHHGAHLLEVVVDSKNEPVLVKAVQWNHLGEDIVHVDLARVDLTEQVQVQLDLELIGEPKALEEEGAILDHPIATVTVECRADSIPEKLTHDIGQLGLEDVVTLADLTLPPGVALSSEMDPETVVAQIQIMAEEPEEEQPVAEGAEPEVIGRGAEEEAGQGEEAEKE